MSVPTRRTWPFRVIGVTLLLCAAHFPTQTTAQPSIAFDRDIRPILEEKCLSCHGGALQLSRLDLRTRETALSGGAHGAALVPGNAERAGCTAWSPDSSNRRCRCKGTPLDGAQMAALKQWIDEGAKWDAARLTLQPAPGDSALARIDRSRLRSAATGRSSCPCRLRFRRSTARISRNPIDRFLEKARAQHKLTPAPRADRLDARAPRVSRSARPAAVAREVAAFIADDTPGAWERLIDKLLASPHYGER